LNSLRDLLADVRDDPNTVGSLKEAILGNVDAAGLQVC
jgi:hypothetical protein